MQNTHTDLFFALDELDHIAEAFEILSSHNKAADLELALKKLRQLRILPMIRLSKDKKQSEIEKHIKNFAVMDVRLKEVSLDCIMAFGKICHILNYDYTVNTPTVTTAVQANNKKQEMQELKEQ